MTIQSVPQSTPTNFFNLLSTPDKGQSLPGTQVNGVAVSNDLSGQVRVATAEGDKVTLSADLQFDFRAVTYSSNGRAGDTAGSIEGEYAQFSLRQSFGVTVEGDLNDQEVRDLDKLFRKISNIFQNLFKGQDDAGFAKVDSLAGQCGKLSSLASLDLNVDVERSFTALAARIASALPNQLTSSSQQGTQNSTANSISDPPGGAPEAAAATPQPPTGTTAPTPPSSSNPIGQPGDSVRVAAATEVANQPGSLIQQIFDSLKHAQVEPEKIQKYLPSFLERLQENLSHELRDRQGRQKDDGQDHLDHQVPPPSNKSTAFEAYQTMEHTSFSLSVQG